MSKEISKKLKPTINVQWIRIQVILLFIKIMDLC